jgi:hypothetical protein
VSLKVLLDLPFGFDYETQAHGIADPSGRQSQGIRPGKPQRVQKARSFSKFLQALCSPCQMVSLLLGGRREHLLQFGFSGRDSLGSIESLRTNLPDVIDPHEGSRVAPLRLG